MRTLKMSNLNKTALRMFILLAAQVGCQTDNDVLNAVDIQNINSESASLALANESADISAKILGELTSSQYSGARYAGDTVTRSYSDGRLACATITLIRTGTMSAPSGEITIDFKDGLTSLGSPCYDRKGIQRKGQIVIAYTGKRYAPGSSFKVSFQNFYRNGTHIEGNQYVTYNGTVNDTLKVKLLAVDTVNVTFGDGRSVGRKESLIKTWFRFINSNTGRIDPLEDEWHIEKGSNSSVTNKNGVTYSWEEVESDLIYTLPCWINKKVFIPVKGTKAFTVGSVNYNIDYGDGTCDNLATITFGNGTKKVITISADGN